MKRCFRIHPHDSVAVACEELSAGEVVTVGEQVVTLRDSIPKGHKIALILPQRE